MRKKDNNERGAIAIIVAAMLTMLSAFAALSIDAGFLYTKSRNIQGIADAAVIAGMPTMPTAGTSQTAAMAIVNANGAFTTSSAVVAGNLLTVEITQTVPSFFGRMLGVGNKTLRGRAIGELTAVAAPAIFAGTGCGTGGFTITGNAAYTITGNVQSNGDLIYSTGPTMGITNGSAQTPCGAPSIADPPNTTITGSTAPPMGTFTDPFASLNLFAGFPPCDYGDFGVVGDLILNGAWFDAGGNLPPGVYCATGSIMALNPIVSGNVTFLATGNIIVGADNGGVLTAFANNIVAFTTLVQPCSSGQAINIGTSNLTINGSIYARNGCIRAGGNTMAVNGSLVGADIFLGISGPWTINSGGGGGGGGWRMKN